MTDDERIALMKRAMDLLDDAGLLLIEATRNHYAASYSLTYDNLVDKNGKPIEIELTNFEGQYQPICVELMEVGREARRSAEAIKKAFGSDASISDEG